MSIRNLTTDNLKPDQNLKVNSIEALTFDVDTLVVNSLTANDITCTSLDATTVSVANDVDVQGTVAAGTVIAPDATFGTCNITVGLNLPTASPFTDLTLNIYAFHQSNITWTIYSFPTTIGNGIRFYRIGRMVVCIVIPFAFAGPSVGVNENTITSDFAFPDTFRPLNIPVIFTSSRIQQNGTFIPIVYGMENSGVYTLFVQRTDQSNFASGVLNLLNDEMVYLTYISLS